MVTEVVYGSLPELMIDKELIKKVDNPVKALVMKWFVLDKVRRNTFILTDYDDLTDRMNTIAAIIDELVTDEDRKDPAWAVKMRY